MMRRQTRSAWVIALAMAGALLSACGSSAGGSGASAGGPPGLPESGIQSVGTASGVPSAVSSAKPTTSAAAKPSASVEPSAKPSVTPPAKGSGSSGSGSSSGSRPRPAYSGVGAADRVAWAAWRGQPVQINEAWNDAKDSSGAVTWDKMDGLYSTEENFSNGKWKGALSIAQPMFARNETVRTCASATEISTWAEDLKKAWPSGSAFIRLGWEFNGNWYGWSMKPGDAAAFKSCWITWYGLVKAVSPGFELVWNPNNQSSDAKLDVRDFWPGAAYVDAAGPDAYALSWGGTLMDPKMKGPNGEPLGIDAWAAWVASKGVPLAVPEWAIRQQSYGSVDPAYIGQMRAAFTRAATSSTGLAYESYFDGGTGYQCQFSIHDSACGDVHQAASDEYKALWSKAYPHK